MRDRFMVTPFFLDEPLPELEVLLREDWRLNKPALPAGDWRQRIPALHRPIARFVADTLARGERPVSIAGDCCTGLGVAAGMQRAGVDPFLIWLDAHGDFNTWETTPSGFLGGMPLAMLVGRGERTLLDALGLRPLPEGRVILADARDLDPAERVALERSEVHHVEDVRELVAEAGLGEPLWVHLDVDVVNPNDAPAQTYRAEGGPTAATLGEVFCNLRKAGRIAAVSLSAWNPALDTDGRTQAVCMELLRTLVEPEPPATGRRTNHS